MVKEIENPEDQKFVLLAGPVLSEYSDKGSYYSKNDFDTSYLSVQGLANEINTAVGKVVMTPEGLYTDGFMGSIGQEKSFELDYEAIKAAGFDGQVTIPLRNELFGNPVLERFRIQFEANLEGFRAFTKTFQSAPEGADRKDTLSAAISQGAETASQAEIVMKNGNGKPQATLKDNEARVIPFLIWLFRTFGIRLSAKRMAQVARWYVGVVESVQSLFFVSFIRKHIEEGQDPYFIKAVTFILVAAFFMPPLSVLLVNIYTPLSLSVLQYLAPGSFLLGLVLNIVAHERILAARDARFSTSVVPYEDLLVLEAIQSGKFDDVLDANALMDFLAVPAIVNFEVGQRSSDRNSPYSAAALEIRQQIRDGVPLIELIPALQIVLQKQQETPNVERPVNTGAAWVRFSLPEDLESKVEALIATKEAEEPAVFVVDMSPVTLEKLNAKYADNRVQFIPIGQSVKLTKEGLEKMLAVDFARVRVYVDRSVRSQLPEYAVNTLQQLEESKDIPVDIFLSVGSSTRLLGIPITVGDLLRMKEIEYRLNSYVEQFA